MTPPRLPTAADARHIIRQRIIELAHRRRIDARDLQDSESILEKGVLDSAGIMELIIWFETTFDLVIDQADLTIENFGTIDAMTGYLQRVSSGHE